MSHRYALHWARPLYVSDYCLALAFGVVLEVIE